VDPGRGKPPFALATPSRNVPQPAVSSQMVTGPSLTSATFMSAPKTPLATVTPCPATAAEKCS